MKGFFLKDSWMIRYSMLIVWGSKTIETRFKDMLKDLVGERVAVIRTQNGHRPMVVGYVDIVEKWYCRPEDFDSFQMQHHVLPSAEKEYPSDGRGKWMYELRNAEECVPFELPETAVRHGRSWCEF